MDELSSPTEHKRAIQGAATDPESRLIQNIIQSLDDVPASIHRIQFRLGEDSQGDPCIWIEFVMEDDLNPSKEKMADVRRLRSELHEKIRLSETDRWPYFRIVTE